MFQLRDFLELIYWHRKKAIAWFCLVMLGVLVYLAIAPRTYSSSSKVFVRLGRENVGLDPTATMGKAPVVSLQPSRETELNSIVEIARSRSVAEYMVDRLGARNILAQRLVAPELISTANPTKPEATTSDDESQATNASAAHTAELETSESTESTSGSGGLMGILRAIGISDSVAERERAIIRVQRSLSVDVLRKSNVLSISYQANDPKLAQLAAQYATEAVLNEHVQANRSNATGDFIDRRTAELQSNLDAREEALRNAKSELNVSSLGERQRILEQRIGSLEDQELNTSATLASSQAESAAIRKKLQELPAQEISTTTAGLTNEGTDNMRAQLYALNLRLHEAQTRYTEDMPVVIDLKRQVKEAEQLLGQQPDDRTSVVTEKSRPYIELEAALAAREPGEVAMQQRLDTIKTQLSNARQELRQVNESERRIAALERERSLAEFSYRQHYESQDSARIAQALESEEITNLNVVQPPALETKPIKPNKLMILVLGTALAVGSTVAMILTLDHFFPAVMSPERAAQKLGSPLLATIPKVQPNDFGISGAH